MKEKDERRYLNKSQSTEHREQGTELRVREGINVIQNAFQKSGERNKVVEVIMGETAHHFQGTVDLFS